MLSQQQLEDFDANGYLVVDDIFDNQTLDDLRQEYSALLDGLYEAWFTEGRVSVPSKELGFFDKLLIAYKAGCDWFQPFDISLPGERIYEDTPMHFGPATFKFVTNTRLLDLAEDLIGPEITSNPIQHIRIKPPVPDLQEDEIRAHITATDWHQDRAVALEEADQTNMITVWCAITDATPENGCLQVIPGGHKEGMKPHCPRTQTAIADNLINESRAIPLPVKSGGVVVFHPLTPHASLTNQTDRFRWSFDLRFNVTGEPTGRSHFPSFVARSRLNPQSVLQDCDAWRVLWEEARARLAVAPHIDIHRWSADAPACA